MSPHCSILDKTIMQKTIYCLYRKMNTKFSCIFIKLHTCDDVNNKIEF